MSAKTMDKINDMVLRPRNGLSLCSGGGGLDMGLMLAEPGFHTRCYVELEGYPRKSIIAAQRAGYFAPAPIWDDVTTFDARPLVGAIDTLIAGYPCQPFSQAGQRKGESDERHLWPDIERIAAELGDHLTWCFFENVRGHVTLGLETVLRALRKMGFSVGSGIFSAEEVGATHERQRVFIVAYRDRTKWQPNSAKPDAGPDGGDDSCRRGRADVGDAEQFASKLRRMPGELSSSDGPTRGQSGPASPNVDHSASPRCDDAGQRSGADQQGGERVSGAGCDQLADASQPGPQGEFKNGIDAKGRKVEAGLAGLRSRTGIFPPCPSDMSAWGVVLARHPDLAPALSVGDVKRASDHFAALVESGHMAQATAESRVRGVADGLASRPRALRLLGNGVVPLEAAYAWRTLSNAHGLRPLDLGTADEQPTSKTDTNGFV